MKERIDTTELCDFLDDAIEYFQLRRLTCAVELKKKANTLTAPAELELVDALENKAFSIREIIRRYGVRALKGLDCKALWNTLDNILCECNRIVAAAEDMHDKASVFADEVEKMIDEGGAEGGA